MLLGLTGSIACGKTTVSDFFKELGANIIDSDILAREAVLRQAPAYKKIVDYFGEEIILKGGGIDRKKLGKIVFNDLKKRKALENIIHPAIRALSEKKIKKIIEKNEFALIIESVPLLIEKKMQEKYDKIIIVYIPEKLQITRLMNRDKISKKEAIVKIKTQIPINEKIKFADYVIYNDKTVDNTKAQVISLFDELKRDIKL